MPTESIGEPPTIDSLVRRAAAPHSNGDAVVDEQRVCTWRELDQLVSALAGALKEWGIQPGYHVAIHMQKSVEQVAALFAVSRAGAAFVIVDGRLKESQVRHILCDSMASLLLLDEIMFRRVRQYNDALPIPCVVVSPESARPLAPASSSSTCDQQPGPVPSELSGGVRLAALIYTSGSTGLPKGVMISHENLFAGTASVTEYLQVRDSDRIASVLPFSFDYGLNQLTCAAAVGGTLAMCSYRFPEQVGAFVRDQGITVLAGVPGLWSQLLYSRRSFREAGPFCGVRCVTNSGGHMKAGVLADLQRVFPRAEVFLMYGLTEAFRSTYLPPVQLPGRSQSIGKAIPGATVWLVDDQGRAVEARQVGEIVHRGPTVAHGYWRRPEDTARVFRRDPSKPPGAGDCQAVVFSGDYGWADEEGYIYFVGRKDHLTKIGDQRVSIDEVEQVIASLDGVLDAAVASGLSGGNGLLACVVCKPDVSQEELLRLCHKNLPRHLVPNWIVVVESFPMLESGKVDRQMLWQMHSGASRE